MSTVLDDLVGLNATTIRDMPVVENEAGAVAIASRLPDSALSIAGLRHSQGGHTVVTDGRMLMTMTALNRIGTPRTVSHQRWSAVIEVDAGASWEELHRALGPYGFAPMVQQSSASFSIGGSISVNCHSRDPRWGPISRTIEDITVLTGKGDVVVASRSATPGLFHAAIGGYGCCGLILRATLRLIGNVNLSYRGDVWRRDVDDYRVRVAKLLQDTEVHLNFAWLCCVRGRLYDEALIVDLVHESMPQEPIAQSVFPDQSWGQDEIERAGWAAARRDPGRMRQMLWDQLCHRHKVGDETGGKGFVDTRIGWLRASVDFTAFRGETSAEILQEYFVPPDRLVEMIDALRIVFADPANGINVLSTTLRFVREDDETVLTYCAGGPRVCIAVDAEVEVAGATGGGKMLAASPSKAIGRAIEAALRLGGCYYLPYVAVADRATFQRAYPRHADLQAAIDTFNPRGGHGHRYWNNFLDRYFD